MTDAYDCYCINLAVNLIFFKINILLLFKSGIECVVICYMYI